MQPIDIYITILLFCLLLTFASGWMLVEAKKEAREARQIRGEAGQLRDESRTLLDDVGLMLEKADEKQRTVTLILEKSQALLNEAKALRE